jgi:hypothetical protein
MLKRLILVLAVVCLAIAPVISQSSVGLELPDEYILEFKYDNPEAGSVSIAGPFQGWDKEKTPMSKEDGVWVYRMKVTPGDNITFKYVVDGEYLSSMEGLAPATTEDGYGGKNGVVAVADIVPSGDDEEVFRSKITFGTYTQIYSNTEFLTSSIAPDEGGNTIRGLETDFSDLVTKSYWKLTADILPGISTFLEIKAFDGAVNLYRQSPDASADPENLVEPEITVIDGIENLGSALFAPFHGINSNALPELGHFKASLKTGVIDFSTGYKYAKSDRTTRELLYKTFSNDASANDGYLEISNGADIRTITDDVTLDILLGLTKRDGGHGMYSWIDLGIADYVVSLSYNTLANRLADNPLRYYFFDARHTVGIGVNAPIEKDLLSIKFEGLTTIDAAKPYNVDQALAFALSGDFSLGSIFKTGFYTKWAGNDVNTLFGENDSLESGKFMAGISPSTRPIDLFQVGVNYDIELDHLFSVDLTNKFNPYLNLYLGSVIGIDTIINGYSKMELTASEFSFSEAGGSVVMKELAEEVTSVAVGYIYKASEAQPHEVYANTRLVNLAEALPTLDFDLGWKSDDITFVTRAGISEKVKTSLSLIGRVGAGQSSPFGAALGGAITLPENLRNGVVFMQLGYDFSPFSEKESEAIEFEDNFVKNVGGEGRGFMSFGLVWNF